jgi:hypothetical protein
MLTVAVGGFVIHRLLAGEIASLESEKSKQEQAVEEMKQSAPGGGPLHVTVATILITSCCIVAL